MFSLFTCSPISKSISRIMFFSPLSYEKKCLMSPKKITLFMGLFCSFNCLNIFFRSLVVSWICVAGIWDPDSL